MTQSAVPEIEVVAIRTSGPHDHIERIKLVDGTDARATTVAAAIRAHEAHFYFVRRDGMKFLLYVRQCPDCLEECLWA